MKGPRWFPAVLAVVTMGCVALDHTNPLDVHADVTINVTASRETLTAVGQTVTFTGTATGFPDAPFRWTAAGSQFSGRLLAPNGSGPQYTLTWGSADAEMPSSVTAWVGPHSTSKKVAFVQAFGGLKFTPCTPRCVVLTNVPNQPITTIFYQFVDSGGTVIGNSHSALPTQITIAAQIVSRNLAIASVVQQSAYSGAYINIRSNQTGSTWLIFSSSHVKDSILVFAEAR
jgi:hypothetical protein